MDLSSSAGMAAPAPALTAPAPAQVSPSVLQNINPQQMMMASVMADLMNTGGRNVGSISQGMSALQPNQTAANNRTALQSLQNFQGQLGNQGGTSGIGGIAKRLVADIPLVGGLTGPGQFEQSRQSTASTIAQATGMSPQAALAMLPNFGEDSNSANTKLQTLQTMLSSGYSGALNPSSMTLPGQQAFGGINANGLSPINAGTGRAAASALPDMSSILGGGAEEAGAGASGLTSAATSMADLAPEALALAP